MVHVPIRGLFMLGRVAFVVAAAAAVPYLLRKNRRLGEQLGDVLIKAGENLKKEEPKPAGEGKVQPAGATARTKSESGKRTATTKRSAAAGKAKTTAATRPVKRRPAARKKSPPPSG
jgi:hypothetical protein